MNPRNMTDPTTALREVLALSNKERDAEENREYGAANDLYAELQVAAVNLIRTHGPALLSALEDARRLDWLDKTRGDDVQRDPRTGEPELVAHYWAVQGQCYDVREAIDDALAAQQGERHD